MQTIKKARILTLGVLCLLFLAISSCNIVVRKQEYVVNFYVQNNLIDTKHVSSGSSVVAPTVPNLEGYIFIGWDQDLSSVKGNLEVYAIYEEIPKDDIDKLQMDLDYLKNQNISQLDVLPSKGYYFNSDINWVSESTDLVITDSFEIIRLNNNETTIHAVLSLNDSILYIELKL